MKSITLLILSLLMANIVYADAEAEIKYRQAVMKSVGGHMASMAAILKGKTHLSDLKAHASSLATMATIVPNVFPEGSAEGKTEALKTIWKDSKKFKSSMDKFVKAANQMNEAASSEKMDAIGSAIKALGQSCKGCHDDFREEQEH